MPEPLDLPLTLAREQLVGAEFGVIECRPRWRASSVLFAIPDTPADGLPCSPESVGDVLGRALDALATFVERSL